MATAKSIIRRMVAEDAAGFLPLLSDPAQRNPHYAVIYTEEEAAERIRSLSVLNESWTVLDRASGKQEGYITLEPEGNREAGCYRMTMEFTTGAYGDTLALEAAGRMLQYAFEALNVRRLVLWFDSRDVGNIDVCKALSMRREGSASEAYLYIQPDTGRPVYRDIVYYAILKKDWLKTRTDG